MVGYGFRGRFEGRRGIGGGAWFEALLVFVIDGWLCCARGLGVASLLVRLCLFLPFFLSAFLWTRCSNRSD